MLDIGYSRAKYGLDAETCGVITSINGQSGDIAQGVNKSLEARQLEAAGEVNNSGFSRLGAGDQGLMYGFATRETPELMPMPIVIAHKLVKRLAEAVSYTHLDVYKRQDMV